MKLPKSVIVIHGIMALGLCANEFAPALSIKDAVAASAQSPSFVCGQDPSDPAGFLNLSDGVCANVITTAEGVALLIKVAE